MESLLWILILLPVAGGGLCAMLRSPNAVLNAIGAGVLGTGVVAGVAAVHVFSTGPLTSGTWLFLDALSAYHLVVMMIVFGLSSLYARTYFRGEIASNEFTIGRARRYGALWFGALAAMTLVLISNNLGIMWVGIEATTLLTAFLIPIHRARASLEATWKYLLISSVGIAFAFMGTLLVAAASSRLHLGAEEALVWTRLRNVAASLDPDTVKVGFLFLLVGYGTKVGLAPMHTWLPDAHSQAPSPVSAMFSGFMLSTALYCIMRYIPIVEAATGGTGWSLRLLVFFGVFSILVGAAFIVSQRDVKRLLAYSSVEHLGIITLGLGLGGLGTFAALFHTLNHSIVKTLGFFCAGRLGQLYGTHNMLQLKGSIRQVPLWGAGLFAALLALIGAAPFAIFMSEFQILKAALDSRSLWIPLLFLLGLAVVFVGALRHAISMAWDEPVHQARTEPARPLEFALVLCPLALLLVLGLWMPDFLKHGLEQAARVIGGKP